MAKLLQTVEQVMAYVGQAVIYLIAVPHYIITRLRRIPRPATVVSSKS